MRAQAVIGASYGDEGKGRTVDWLAASLGPEVVVVRSNGGAQAGHTVETGGQRHVFHHIGSAALRGAATHLSRFMVSHPILLAEECAALGAMGLAPRITADPRGWVTTPWDMMVNQAAELARGKGRHGSCGLGFGETVGRCEQTAFALTVADLWSADLRGKLHAIRSAWLGARAAELGLDPHGGPLEHASADGVLERFLDQCAAFRSRVELSGDAALGRQGPVIFEAAQGLLLDQGAEGFPFVTRSSTGLANIAAIAGEAGISALEVTYATRCYLTRHGRGPMEDERAIDGWFVVEDATNHANPWQETLRFGLLCPERLGERIAADLGLGRGLGGELAITASLALTCLDQARGGCLAWLERGAVVTGDADALAAKLVEAAGLPLAVQFASPNNDFTTQYR